MASIPLSPRERAQLWWWPWPGFKFVFQTEPGEKILGMIKFRGAVLIATDRRVVSVDGKGGVKQVIPKQ